VSNLFNRLSRHRGALILLCAAINVSMLVVHTIASNMYYESMCIRMQMVAGIAVKAGAVYLPADPRTAVQVADASVKRNGFVPNEIVSTEVAENDRTLTIVLKRELPTYVALFILGVGWPGCEIKVTAQAKKRSGHLQTRA
jgi:hypothetical protein